MIFMQQELQKTTDSATRHPMLIKKRKGIKKPGSNKKFPGIRTSDEVLLEEVEDEVSGNESDHSSQSDESLNSWLPPVEKRKQEGSEWKPLKKIDYQRLETVLEEVQPSVEAMSSRNEYEMRKSSSDVSCDFGHGKSKKPYNFMSIVEHSEVLSGDDELQRGEESQAEEKRSNHEQTMKRQTRGERCEKFEIMDARGEPADVSPRDFTGKYSQDKRNSLFNGMMEILPIFSNDMFVCSRDAISIEDYEEMDTLEKTAPWRAVTDGKPFKDNRTIETKPLQLVNSRKKSCKERLTEKHGDCKEIVKTKLHQSFAERMTRHSSPFINFLLVLSPFAEDRERFFTDSEDVSKEKRNTSSEARALRKGGLIPHHLLYGVVFTTFGLVSVLLGLAWRSYEPPNFIDYILSIIPFLNYRRTSLQVFFDTLMEIIACVWKRLGIAR